MTPAALTMIALAHQVRSRTIYILKNAPPNTLLWTPPGTANHLTWHAGHALWVQDAICIEPLTGASELPPNWPARFAMRSTPATDPGPWPTRDLLLDLLTHQLPRLETLLAAATPETLGDPNLTPTPTSDPSLAWEILHGLHDEAIHQGEMHLLLKLARTT